MTEQEIIPDEIEEEEPTKRFSVSLCLSIDATDENHAVERFYELAAICDFDRDSIEVEGEIK